MKIISVVVPVYNEEENIEHFYKSIVEVFDKLDYEFELDDAVQKELGIKDQEDMLIYVIITIPQGRIEDMTANLTAPVVLNKKNMQAKQVVLEKGGYTTRHRLFPEKKKA